jgi:hypothetical protein
MPYWLIGHYLDGRKVVDEILASPTELSDQARARVRTIDGMLAALLSDLTAAQAELDEALAWCEMHDDGEVKGTALAGLGIATAPIDPERARTLMLESARVFAGIEDVFGEAIALDLLGWLDVGRGDFTTPDLFERAYLLARGLDDDVATAHAATNLAELRIVQGRFEEARELLVVALTAHKAVRLYDGASYAFEAVAQVADDAGRGEDAARLLGAAAGVRNEAGIPIWGPRLSRFETLKASVRDALGDERGFESAWTDGQTLGLDASLEAAYRALR